MAEGGEGEDEIQFLRTVSTLLVSAALMAVGICVALSFIVYVSVCVREIIPVDWLPLCFTDRCYSVM